MLRNFRLAKSLGLAGAVVLLLACQPIALAQLGRGTGTTGRNTLGGAATQGFGRGNTTAVSQASQNVGTVLSASDFGGADQGNLLRTAIAGQTLAGLSQANSFNQLSALGGLGAFGRGGFGQQGFGQFGQLGDQFGANNQQRGANLKIPMRIGFSLPTASVLSRATQLESRIRRIPGFEQTQGISIKLSGTTAILEGTVATDRERDLIARLAMLEPGIYSVQNDLKVVPGPDSAPLPMPSASP